MIIIFGVLIYAHCEVTFGSTKVLCVVLYTWFACRALTSPLSGSSFSIYTLFFFIFWRKCTTTIIHTYTHTHTGTHTHHIYIDTLIHEKGREEESTLSFTYIVLLGEKSKLNGTRRQRVSIYLDCIPKLWSM